MKVSNKALSAASRLSLTANVRPRNMATKQTVIAYLLLSLSCFSESVEDDVTVETLGSNVILREHNPDLVTIPDWSNLCFVANNPHLNFHTLTADSSIGFCEYKWTNMTLQVEATYDGGYSIEFSNGIELYFDNKPVTVENVIVEMERTLEFMSMPSSAKDHEYPAAAELKYMEYRKQTLTSRGFTRRWYLVNTEKSEQEAGPYGSPAAGSPSGQP